MLDLAAAGAGQVAGEQRLDLDDQRELLAPRELLCAPGTRRCACPGGTGMGISAPRRAGELDRLVDDAALARRSTGPSAREGGDHALDQRLGRRRAGGDADGAGRRRARSRSSSAGVLDEYGRRSPRAGPPRRAGWSWTSWPSRPRARGRTRRRWPAPPPGGSAWRSRCRRRAGPTMVGKRCAQGGDDRRPSRRGRAWSG